MELRVFFAVFLCCSANEQWIIKVVYPLKGLLFHGCRDLGVCSTSAYQQLCLQNNEQDSFQKAQNR